MYGTDTTSAAPALAMTGASALHSIILAVILLFAGLACVTVARVLAHRAGA